MSIPNLDRTSFLEIRRGSVAAISLEFDPMTEMRR